MADFLNQLYYGNTAAEWLLALSMIVGSFIAGRFLYWLFGRWLKRRTRRTQTRLDDLLIDMLEEPFSLAFVLLGVRYAVGTLSLTQEAAEFVDNVFGFLIALVVTWFFVRFYDALHRNYLVRLAQRTQTDLDDQILPVLRTGIKFIIISLGIIIGLNNAGYDVGTILAGLGIGGLAFALAAQDTVSNVFGGITVLIQRPFKPGERIQVAGLEGYVRTVGLRSSTIEMISGEEMLVPNKLFINETIKNMDTARYYYQADTFHLHRSTDSEQLARVFELLNEIGQKNEHLVWAEAALLKVGEYSLDVELMYGVVPWKPDQSFDHYVHKMATVRSQINRACYRAFEANNVKLATPFLAYSLLDSATKETVFQP